ncbi:lytic transglycosylase domain-containing protein [Bordetella sp. 2513F-2]
MQRDLEPRRYQKSAATAGALRRWLPALALVATACAPVDAQQRAAANGAPAVARPDQASPVIAVPRAVLAGLPPSPDGPARQAVVAAREAMRAKQWSVLGAALPQAAGDPLQPYAEYWLLRYQLWNPPGGQRPTAAVQRFLDAHAGTYLADRLRGDAIMVAVRSGDFEGARDLGEPQTGSAQLGCARLEARHMTGQRARAQEALDVFQPGTSCWQLYDQLVADGVLGWDEILPQLRDAIEVDRTADARKLAAYIFEPADQKAFAALLKDPMKWLVRQSKSPVGRNEKELVTIALARLARADMDVGDAYLRREWAPHLPKAHVAWIRSQFALIAALNHDGRAHEWYREAGSVRLTEYNHAWRVRAALRESPIDWPWVIASIEEMPTSQQAEAVWVYWKARGHAALGRTDTARQGYERIAGKFEFYGQLAAEELGRPVGVPPMAAPVTDAEMAEARANPGLQRAVELFRLGWRPEAVPEWNFALRGMSDRQLLAAAELARAEGIYDRVVNTSELTRNEFDFTQRYIAPFEGRVSAKARAIGLDPAWVYGLIRQESRFVTEARSHVGASGLMQLMPATAKYVARKIGMADFKPSSVHDFDVNTELGTQYLNMVLQGLDGSQVLASAGYNAGPGRPRNWRASLSHPVEGAIFAETIPFTETRLYVKHVLANATYYAALFSGQPQSLKARLGRIVPPQAMAANTGPGRP